jgi:hypothetical protein
VLGGLRELDGIVGAANPRPQDGVLGWRNRRGRIDLDRAELLGNLHHVARPFGIEQLGAHNDAAGLVARELVRHGLRLQRRRRVPTDSHGSDGDPRHTEVCCTTASTKSMGSAVTGGPEDWSHVDAHEIYVVTPIGYVGIAVALGGAFLLSFGSAVQQRGVTGVGTRTDGKGGLAIRQLLKLATNRQWLLGSVMVVLAVVCQLTALGLAPITVVQPVGVLALVITAIISARTSHKSLGAAAVRDISLCVVAVVTFVTIASMTTRVAAIHNSSVVVVLIIVAAAVLVLGVSFLLWRKRLTRIFYVIASGVLFGFVATLAKVIIGRVETVVAAHHSPFGVGGLTYLCLAGIILAGLLGQYLQQSAFTSGSPDVVVAGLTVVDPIVGATIGLAVLGEAASTPGWAFIVFALAGAMAVFGVVRLSQNRPVD